MTQAQKWSTAASILARPGEARDEIHQLRRDRTILVAHLKTAASLCSMQAVRDANDPHTCKGWRDAANSMIVTLRELGEWQ